MVPHRRFKSACDAEFVVGDVYQMVVQEQRSMRSHAHYFASVNEAWLNLSESDAERFPSVEHLRKFALIRTGFANSRQLVAS
jgi:protein gp37